MFEGFLAVLSNLCLKWILLRAFIYLGTLLLFRASRPLLVGLSIGTIIMEGKFSIIYQNLKGI